MLGEQHGAYHGYLETPVLEGDGLMHYSAAHGPRSPSISDLLLGVERSTVGYALHSGSDGCEERKSAGTALRSADDCAAANALAMLFECASRVEKQGT